MEALGTDIRRLKLAKNAHYRRLGPRLDASFPHSDHTPPKRAEFAAYASVAGHIRSNLLYPVVAVMASGKPCHPIRKVASVPEIPIYKDGDPFAVKHDVRTSGQSGNIRPELQT